MRSFIIFGLVFAVILHAQSFAAPTDAQLFRSLFAATLEPTDQARIDHLIFAPSPGLFDEAAIYNNHECRLPLATAQPEETPARYKLCQLTTAFAAVSAQQLYDQGLKSTTTTTKDDLERLTRLVDEQDILLVIVPGIFGEFIDKRAFEEVFPLKMADGTIRNDSTFARQWRSKFSDNFDCANASSSADVFCDEQDKLERMTLDKSGHKNVSLQHLLHAGSIDDGNGHPAIRALLFQVDGMSLESLGAQQENAAIFNRRLEKFFQVMGYVPEHIVLIGYSRGTDYALEMLAQAQRDHKPWLRNVASLVSLGGVVWGSALADEVHKSSTNSIHRQLKLLAALRKQLSPLPQADKGIFSASNGMTLLSNTVAWYRFAKDAASLQSSEQTSVSDWIVQALKQQRIPDPRFVVDLLVSELMNFGLFNKEQIAKHQKTLQAALDDAKQGNFLPLYTFLTQLWPKSEITPEGFDSFTLKYNMDLKRFEKLAAASTQAVFELTTDSRLEWWRSHEVPMHVHYYSVSATMADPATDLGQNPWGYVPGSPDDQALVKNWQNFQKVEISGEYRGTALNDSQVAVQKTVFWPQLIASLNPKNKGLQATALGVLGTHHWGMTLPVVTQTRPISLNGNDQTTIVNPFPRVALLKTLALAIANDLQETGRN